jgi:hypothetical protein
MTANNKPWKVRRTLLSCKNPSMSCRNPRDQNSAETLGPKIKISSICNLRVVGGALKEAVHTYAKLGPTFKWKVLKLA